MMGEQCSQRYAKTIEFSASAELWMNESESTNMFMCVYERVKERKNSHLW